MSSNNLTVAPASLILVLMMLVGIARSDLAQDRTECANQLVGLAPCLPYVGGTAKAPTLDCCSGLKQVIDKSKKCLCILIKDRDDPSLGLKINATLAAELPDACRTPANVTECIDILHLAPNSPEAKVFAGFANISKGVGSSTSATSASSNGTNADQQSHGGRSMGWFGMEMMWGCLLWAFISCILI